MRISVRIKNAYRRERMARVVGIGEIFLKDLISGRMKSIVKFRGTYPVIFLSFAGIKHL